MAESFFFNQETAGQKQISSRFLFLLHIAYKLIWFMTDWWKETLKKSSNLREDDLIPRKPYHRMHPQHNIGFRPVTVLISLQMIYRALHLYVIQNAWFNEKKKSKVFRNCRSVLWSTTLSKFMEKPSHLQSIGDLHGWGSGRIRIVKVSFSALSLECGRIMAQYGHFRKCVWPKTCTNRGFF